MPRKGKQRRQSRPSPFTADCGQLASGAPEKALRHLLKAAALAPDDPPVLEKLAQAHARCGQYMPALRAYDRIIELGAATADTWRATGNALADVGEYAQAIGAFRNGLELRVEDPEAHHNLARMLYRMGEVDRAVEHLRTAAAQSDAPRTWLSLATLIPGAPSASHGEILEVRRECAVRLAEAAGVHADKKNTAPAPRAGRKPRVGYLSSFFESANYMKPVWALLNHHDRGTFEIHLFSDSPPESEMAGYRPHAGDTVHATANLSNEGLAELIRQRKIDILVDLNAFSTPERLPLFLQPLAPATVAWFNMYATSGLPAIHYIVGDAEVITAEEERFFSEKVLRLPLGYLTFEVSHPVPPVTPPPCKRNGFITFGSLVSQYKVTQPVLDAWAELLNRAPSSRLLMANTALKSVHNRAYVRAAFAARGVDAERLELCGPAEHLAFLRYYDRIDIALDAFPYNGGTTTMEAIWQGVPVLTFGGDRWASRTSRSILRKTHLERFVAGSVEEMVDDGVALANDAGAPSRLSALRREMRARLSASPACNGAALARAMEALYQGMLSLHPLT